MEPETPAAFSSDWVAAAGVPDAAGSVRTRLGRALSWNLAGAVCTSICNFALTLCAARLLGREHFGEYGMIQSTAVTLSGIAQLAIGYTATRYVAEFRAYDKDRAGRIVALCSAVGMVTAAIATLALLVAARWIAADSLKAPQLATGLMLSSAFVGFATMGGYQSGVLAGLESYRAMAQAFILSSIFNLAAAVTGVLVWGLPGLLAGVGIGSAMQWLIFRRFLIVECRAKNIVVSYRGIYRERTIILRFALPASIGGFISMPAAWFANACLARQAAGFSELGTYSAALSLRSLILFLPLLMNQVSMSLLNHERGRRKPETYRRLFYANLGITAALLFAGVGVVAAFGPWLLSVFGKSFRAGYAVTVIVLVGTAFDGIIQAPYQLIQSHERMWLSVWLVTLPRDICLVVLAYVLTPKLGALGLATAAATGSAVALMTTVMIASSIGLQFPAADRVRS